MEISPSGYLKPVNEIPIPVGSPGRKTYWVYILECADGTFYTGITSRIEARMAEHREGHDPLSYTARRRPLKLVYTRAFGLPMDAIRFEKQVKGWKREKKLALICGFTEMLSLLSRRRR